MGGHSATMIDQFVYLVSYSASNFAGSALWLRENEALGATQPTTGWGNESVEEGAAVSVVAQNLVGGTTTDIEVAIGAKDDPLGSI